MTKKKAYVILNNGYFVFCAIYYIGYYGFVCLHWLVTYPGQKQEWALSCPYPGPGPDKACSLQGWVLKGGNSAYSCITVYADLSQGDGRSEQLMRQGLSMTKIISDFCAESPCSGWKTEKSQKRFWLLPILDSVLCQKYE